MSDEHKPLNLRGHTREELEKLTQKLYKDLLKADELKLTDHLTKLGNRRRLDFDYGRLSERKNDHNVGVLIADIDHFKVVNDTFGHLVGDWALQRLAVEITKPLRASDIPYRFGGEEFAIIVLPHGSPDSGHAALQIKECARRVREHIQNVPWWRHGVPPITISIGYAQGNYSTPLEKLISEADRALYRAKKAGRNQIAESTYVGKILQLSE